MKILSQNGNFIEAIIAGRWVTAKVFVEPSTYGINNGHISKLSVSKTNTRELNKNFFDQMCYNYDRGLDFDDSGGKVDEIVAVLEAYCKTNLVI